MQTCKLSIKCVAWLKKEIFGNWGKKMKHFDIYYYVLYIYDSKSLTSKGNQGKLKKKEPEYNA